MILGRNTVQIMALVTATLQFVRQVTPVLLPGVDPNAMSVILDATSALLAVWIAVIANNSTTPVHDPQIEKDTLVRVTDGGRVVAHVPITVPDPEPDDDAHVPAEDLE
jgi:hypothetical protein